MGGKMDEKVKNEELASLLKGYIAINSDKPSEFYLRFRAGKDRKNLKQVSDAVYLQGLSLEEALKQAVKSLKIAEEEGPKIYAEIIQRGRSNPVERIVFENPHFEEVEGEEVEEDRRISNLEPNKSLANTIYQQARLFALENQELRAKNAELEKELRLSEQEKIVYMLLAEASKSGNSSQAFLSAIERLAPIMESNAPLAIQAWIASVQAQTVQAEAEKTRAEADKAMSFEKLLSILLSLPVEKMSGEERAILLTCILGLADRLQNSFLPPEPEKASV